MFTTTKMTMSICFEIHGDAYWQMTAWQQSVDMEILRYQLETRGHAMVTRLKGVDGLQRVGELPGLGEAVPYYGTYGGAYRYIFHPSQKSCDLEVFNQMGGFAYFYPTRIEPLQIRLFDSMDFQFPYEGRTAALVNSQLPIDENNPQTGILRFQITASLYRKLMEWTWIGQPWSAYNFVFVPTTGACLAHVIVREVGAKLWLSKEESF